MAWSNYSLGNQRKNVGRKNVGSRERMWGQIFKSDIIVNNKDMCVVFNSI